MMVKQAVIVFSTFALAAFGVSAHAATQVFFEAKITQVDSVTCRPNHQPLIPLYFEVVAPANEGTENPRAAHEAFEKEICNRLLTSRLDIPAECVHSTTDAQGWVSEVMQLPPPPPARVYGVQLVKRRSSDWKEEYLGRGCEVSR